MASVYLVKRQTKTKGTRWHVRCETPGEPIQHLGAFNTRKHAEDWKKHVEAEMRVGKPPPKYGETGNTTGDSIQVIAPAWLATRHDLATGTLKNYRRSLNQLPAWLSSMQPAAVTYTEVQQYVTELSSSGRARGTIEREIIALRGLLDYAGIAPNPTVDRRVRLPRRVRKPHRLPNRAQILVLHDALPTYRELMILLEHTGLRIHEAAALRWVDFDRKKERFLVQDSKTSAGRRWVDRLPGTPAFPVMPKGTDANSRVFGPPSTMDLTTRIGKAHKADKRVPRFSAHDFRHLHASRLLHQQILSPAQIAARLGHADPGITLKVYSHVTPPDD